MAYFWFGRVDLQAELFTLRGRGSKPSVNSKVIMGIPEFYMLKSIATR